LSDLTAKSNPAEAINLLERSLRLEQSAKRYYELAKLQNDSGRYKDALESIKLALSLRDSNSDYYEERERAYKERERAEVGLGVGESDRKRHLAAGYTEIGDIMLRQLNTSQANRAYQESKQVLSDLSKSGKNEGVSADLTVVNSKLSHLSEVARTTTILEWASSRILAVMRSGGPTREVTIDRGSDDGITAGGEGQVLSIYSKDGDHERKIQSIAKARVLSVAPRSATVEVTMDHPEGDGLVRVGDMVEVKAKVPPLPDRSVLWRLAKYHIMFTSEDSKRVHTDYRRLYTQENPELEDEVLDEMANDIRETAKLLAAREVMSKTLTAGRFKGKTLRQVMESPTRVEVLDFLNSVMKYPRDYYGQDSKIGRAFGIWVLGGAP
jgi:tetratricopeptide (TPR) repeat protein